MEYYKEIGQIHERIVGTEAYLMNCLNQGSLQAIYNEVVARTGWYADHKPNFPPQSIHEKRAYGFVRQTYAEPVADENALIVQLVRIQHFLTAFKYIFSSPNFGPECFPWLLDNFCKSQVCKELIANWSHDLSGSRKDLESAIKESDELSRWWPKVKNCPPHAIYDALDFVSEDERHNTENWVQILKIYALLAEYDECHSETAEGREKPRKSGRAESPFIKFIVDPSQSEGILKRLHELIDTKPPKICAQTIFAAQQKGWITLPSHAALFKEFPEIGDKGNYKYHKERRDYYKDDIDAIEKSL